MKSAYSISLTRLLLLIRNSIIINRNLIIIIAAVILTLLILHALKNKISGEDSFDLYFLVLYVAGFGLTLKISRELHDTRKANTWLLLPASTLEKYITLLLLPTLLLAFGLIVYMAIATFVIEICLNLFITSDSNLFNPFNVEMLIKTAAYFAILSPFFLGAVYFKKHVLSYTFLFLFVYGAVFWIFTIFTGKYFLSEHISEHMKLIFPGFNLVGESFELGDVDTAYAMAVLDSLIPFMETWKPIVKAFYWFAAPILFLVSAFFSFKELEQ